MTEFLGWAKGNWGLAEFLSQCDEAEIPYWIRDTCRELRKLCQPPASHQAEAEGNGRVPTPPAAREGAGSVDYLV